MPAFVETIVRKRNGRPLAGDEIREFVAGFCDGTIPAYQAAALLMAVYYRGLGARETKDLTRAMIESGEVYDLSAIAGRKVDKHSTGGVGDKVSIALAPWVAAAGGVVPMVSGRGLGHTGGTLDKLESIPGFKTRLTQTQFKKQLARIGVAMSGQSARLVPADGKMYALRDVTGTVESIPLIAASILSKKVASGNDALVMDVKTGSGAFMAKAADARRLARTLVTLGNALGLKTVAYLTDMSQPLGAAIGNALEVRECVQLLRGESEGLEDLRDLTLELGARMLVLGRVEKTMDGAKARLARTLESGAAFERFLAMVEAQGGDPRKVERPEKLAVAPMRLEVRAGRAGVVAGFDTREVGLAATFLGAGRKTMDDKIDPGVGFELRKKIGEPVGKRDVVWRIFARSAATADEAGARLQEATRIVEPRGARAGKGVRLIREFIE